MKKCGASVGSEAAAQMCQYETVLGRDVKLQGYAQVASIGAHHDTITGTSKPHVHREEKLNFDNAILNLRQLVDQQVNDFFETKQTTADNLLTGSKSFLIEQFYVYNQVLYDRSVVIPLDQQRPDPTLKYIVRFNGEPVESYTHSSFECKGLTVTENEKIP